MRSATRAVVTLAIAGAALAFAPDGALAGVHVRVEAPLKIVDGQPLLALVTVTNTATTELTVAALVQDVTLFARITPLEDFGSGKCHTRVVSDARTLSRVSTLAPLSSVTAPIDLLAPYPFGLPPGRYRLVAEYRTGERTVTSAPAEFAIETSPTDAYRSFLSICRDFRNGGDATAETIQFVKANPSFRFADALLELARNRAKDEMRMELNRMILERSPSPESVERADSDVRRMAQRSKELAEYAAYIDVVRAQLNDPANPAIRDYRRLGTILQPDDFASHQEFLRTHRASFFAADVIQGMIAAVEQGILPPGAALADADRLLVDYYGDLLRGDDRNYHVRKARRDPAVAQLLSRGARE